MTGFGGAPIVLLHSLGTDERLWRHQIEPLSELGEVLVPSTRGHGGTPWPGWVDEQAWISDLHALVGELEPVHLVGVSMGGMQGIAFAAAHPEAVVSLTVANAFATLGHEAGSARIALIRDRIAQIGMTAYADEYLGQTLTRELPADDIEMLRDAIGGMSAEAYIASAEATFGGDVTDGLARITCPVLTLTGENDAKTPLSALQMIADGIDTADAPVVIPAAGHLSCIENPDAFTRVVTDFIQTVNARAMADATEVFR